MIESFKLIFGMLVILYIVLIELRKARKLLKSREYIKMYMLCAFLPLINFGIVSIIFDFLDYITSKFV